MLIIVLTLRKILIVLVGFVKSVKAASGLLYEEDSDQIDVIKGEKFSLPVKTFARFFSVAVKTFYFLVD